MRTIKALRAATLFCILLMATAGGAFAQAKAANATYSYYASGAFPHLTDPSPVFKTTTYDQLINLFESDGTYLILFGGEWCVNTQAVIGQINDVAKEYGVKTIYNFDTKLDSATLQIRDSKSPFANYYVDMVNKYLPNIVTIYDKATTNISYTDKDGKVLVANKLQVPFLFLYNRNNKDAQGNPAPIIASYEKMFVWETDFQTNGKDDKVKIEAYKKEIRPLFDAISTKVGGKMVAKLDYQSDNAYYTKQFNKKGAPNIVLDASDAKDWRIVSTTYPEMVRILGQSGNFVLLYGGTWCPNTRASIKLINQYAVKYGISAVYNFDWRLDSGGQTLHLRNSANPFANLYVDVINKYFPGIDVLYGSDRKMDISYTNKDGAVVPAVRMQVPYVMIYNKDRKDAAGKSAPIFAGPIEYMYQWADLVPGQSEQPAFKDGNGLLGDPYKNYTTALDKLFSQIRK
ncbi:MAG: hypothetical protein WCL50_00995 [Spirochaetota bacterium]